MASFKDYFMCCHPQICLYCYSLIFPVFIFLSKMTSLCCKWHSWCVVCFVFLRGWVPISLPLSLTHREYSLSSMPTSHTLCRTHLAFGAQGHCFVPAYPISLPLLSRILSVKTEFCASCSPPQQCVLVVNESWFAVLPGKLIRYVAKKSPNFSVSLLIK